MKVVDLRVVLQDLSNVGFANFTIDQLINHIDTSPGGIPAEPPAPSPCYDPQWCAVERRLCRFAANSDILGWRCAAPGTHEMLCR